jgi:1-acyl-sn-glycerol-3-phosphate acyltransferase
MALRANCPVVPVGLIGTLEIMPKEAKFPHLTGDVSVRFGTPMHVDAVAAADDPLYLRTFVDRLMFEIVTLTCQEYTGHYVGREPTLEQTEAPQPQPAVVGAA